MGSCGRPGHWPGQTPATTQVYHPDPQILQPGDRAEACVIVDPERADVPVGATAEFAVTCFIGSAMIGGVNLLIIRMQSAPPRPAAPATGEQRPPRARAC
jgi:hypothetical protein